MPSFSLVCGGRSAKSPSSVFGAVPATPFVCAASAARSEPPPGGIKSRGRARSIPNLRLVGPVDSPKQRMSHSQPRSVGGSPISRSAIPLTNAVCFGEKHRQSSEGVGVDQTCRFESSGGGSDRDSSAGVLVDACRTVSINDDVVGTRSTKSGDNRTAARPSITSRGRSTSMTIQGSTPFQVRWRLNAGVCIAALDILCEGYAAFFNVRASKYAFSP